MARAAKQAAVATASDAWSLDFRFTSPSLFRIDAAHGGVGRSRTARDPLKGVSGGDEYSEQVTQYDPYAPREAEPEYEYSPVKHGTTLRDFLRKLWAPIAAVGVLFWKLKFIFAAIFKFKLFTVAGSMLISIGAYALFWGWQFAIGFVVLLLVHELGHVAEAKHQGLPVSAPMFIPFLGALITLKELPDNAWNEAKVAIAGPIVGGLGAAVTWGLGEYFDSQLLVALAFTGFFLNLFNLAPISPLDGGRIVASIHPALWIVGLILLVGLAIVAPNPILILILVLGGLESWRRWQHRADPQSAAYYSVTRTQRIVTGVAYITLAALLTLAMSGSYVERDI
jgi:Zn-dependent protease